MSTKVESLRQALAGVAVVLTTPFTADGTGVDAAGLRRNMAYLLDRGVKHLVPVGGTGEFQSLTEDECRRIVAITAEANAGRAVLTAGVGGALPAAVSLARHSQAAGADGILIHPLNHTYASEEGYLRYCMAIAESVAIGVVLYIRQPVRVETLRRLFALPNVVGAKYAVNDLNVFANTVAEIGPGPVWSCGTAERWAPFYWLAGAVGFTSGIANFAPDTVLALLAALRAGDYARAMALRAALAPFEELRARHNNANNIPAVKAAMDLLGLAGGTVRAPLEQLSPEDGVDMRQLIRAMGLTQAEV